MRMMTAAKRFGLYSAFRACRAIFFRSSLQPRFTVETMFCSCGTIWHSTDMGVRGVIGPPEKRLPCIRLEEGVAGSWFAGVAPPSEGVAAETDFGWPPPLIASSAAAEECDGVARPEAVCLWAGEGAEMPSWWAGCIGDGCTSICRVRFIKCCASGSMSFWALETLGILPYEFESMVGRFGGCNLEVNLQKSEVDVLAECPA